jgi:acyl-CoA hydrolase
MPPRRLSPHELASALPPGGRTLIATGSGESLVLATAVAQAGAAIGSMVFTGIFVPGLNTHTYLANPGCRVETFFLTPELKAAGEAVKLLPLCYADILARLRSLQIDAALFMVTPPNEEGECSFGPVVDFLAELWPRIPVRIAHINSCLPRAASSCSIPFQELTAFVEGEQELLGLAPAADDPIADAIGKRIAEFVSDGATIQTGLGKIPTAALRALTARRDLTLHSGLIPDAVCDLQDAGALADGISVTGGVAIGSRRLYDRVGGGAYRFEPASFTHSPRVIAGFGKPVSINSALEVDLYGQAFGEFGPAGLSSGPGGASDFARGVWVAGGLRIVALVAAAAKGRISRIVAPGESLGPVSLGRMDTDVVVTEFGAADLRGLDHHERASALIRIAPPDHRERLREAWSKIAAKF